MVSCLVSVHQILSSHGLQGTQPAPIRGHPALAHRPALAVRMLRPLPSHFVLTSASFQDQVPRQCRSRQHSRVRRRVGLQGRHAHEPRQGLVQDLVNARVKCWNIKETSGPPNVSRQAPPVAARNQNVIYHGRAGVVRLDGGLSRGRQAEHHQRDIQPRQSCASRLRRRPRARSTSSKRANVDHNVTFLCASWFGCSGPCPRLIVV